MDQKVSVLLIFTLFFVKSVTSVATITPFATTTHQACPTLPPSCNGTLDCEFMHIGPQGATILKTVVAQVAIVDYDGNILLYEYVRPDAPQVYWRTSRDYLYINGTSPAKMISKVHEIVKDKIIVGFNMFNDITGLWISNSPDMFRDLELCPKYKRAGGGTISLKDAVLMDLNRTIQQNIFHDALEDALATMELFRVNQEFWDDMIPTREFRVTKTSEPTLAPCPTAAPVCLPPTDDYIALSLMSAVFGRGRKAKVIPLQVTLVDYEHNVVINEYILQNITDLQTNVTGITPEIYYAEARNFTDVQSSVINETDGKIINGFRLLPSIKLLKLDHKYEKMRELQRAPPIRFDPILRNNPPSLDIFIKNELNMSLFDHGLPSNVSLI
ncbi:interferon-stimulated 20 kDa exonuclease-like 2 [Gigaspora margarita]|uniref:Interferon-stimulated 20 kDa exonuclease-like 2 n=1 Tax=Gigaspora margarita TaxID=4874 RepID=A0A8H3XK81_GIGMA|nr:interferon-stimulated 20 kDa exonuclease-like 2 [Gigaspora margarita]